jgi:hypothetical protein
MIFRAGFALKIVGSFVNGLMPSRAFVAGFLMTMNLASPGTMNVPVFLSSLWPIAATASITPFYVFSRYLVRMPFRDLLYKFRFRHCISHLTNSPRLSRQLNSERS